MLQIQKIDSNLIGENCWIISQDKQAVIIDPGSDTETILTAIADLKITWILLTHSHYDHIQALAQIVQQTQAPVAIHESEAAIIEHGKTNPDYALVDLSPVPVERKLKDGDVIELADQKIKVIHTPGHTPGSCCFLVGKDLFSGDTIFHETCGRTDLEGGDSEAMRSSLEKLMKLPEDTIIHPGHGSDWTIREARQFHFPI